MDDCVKCCWSIYVKWKPSTLKSSSKKKKKLKKHICCGPWNSTFVWLHLPRITMNSNPNNCSKLWPVNLWACEKTEKEASRGGMLLRPSPRAGTDVLRVRTSMTQKRVHLNPPASFPPSQILSFSFLSFTFFLFIPFFYILILFSLSKSIPPPSPSLQPPSPSLALSLSVWRGNGGH